MPRESNEVENGNVFPENTIDTVLLDSEVTVPTTKRGGHVGGYACTAVILALSIIVVTVTSHSN